MSQHEEFHPVRWLAGILIGIVLSSLSGLGMIALRHEGQISSWGARIDEVKHVLERMERKLDQSLKERP